MKLISLSANKESFKKVLFKNETGLNFIVATQKNPGSSEKGLTYNGVGKSLLVALIHFCLGSSKKDNFKKDLSGWIFTLSFKIESKEFISERSVDSQNKIILNSEELTIKEFNKKLELLLFDIPKETTQLSFRSLISFFIRPRRSSYTSFDNPNSAKNEYQIQINNGLLLGLDVLLAEEKFRLRNEKERIRNLVKELSSDKLLKDFFVGRKDISLAQQELKEQITILENDLKNFNVAEDYYEIKIKANNLKNELDGIQNHITLIQNQMHNIDESIKISPDIKRENIEKIYREASVVLKEETLKTLIELERFYDHISKSREKRLLDQKNELGYELSRLNEQKERYNQELDSKLKYLDAHQALDIFIKLNNQLSDSKIKYQNISRYNDLLSEYRKSKYDIEEKFIESTKETEYYISEASEIIKSTTDFFREIVKRFYPNSAAGITVYNNDGDNQIRYDIDAKIEADASDGINNIKIFCYDLTLLLKGYSHKINFLFHDSRLLDGINPRQTAELFRVLNEYINRNKKQYILTLNQNQIDEIRDYLGDKDFSQIITNNICLELKDNTPGDKLLGIQIDMDYN